MDVRIDRDGDAARVAITGSLNTNTASQLEREIDPVLDQVRAMTFDCAELDYVSSAGLRVFMVAYKRLGGQGVGIEHVNDEIREVLDITGFSTLFDVR